VECILEHWRQLSLLDFCNTESSKEKVQGRQGVEYPQLSPRQKENPLPPVDFHLQHKKRKYYTPVLTVTKTPLLLVDLGIIKDLT